jgi:hypothetical protein
MAVQAVILYLAQLHLPVAVAAARVEEAEPAVLV